MKDEKLVIFDWGGVIESHRNGEYNTDTAIIKMIRRFNNSLTDEEILSKYRGCLFDEEGIHINAISSTEKVKEFFKRVKRSLNLDCTFEDFCKVYEEEYMKIFYYKDVVKYIHSLKGKCKIGILSNLCYLDRKRIDMHVDLSKFDYTWLSYELECRKPDERIYKIVEETCGTKVNDILFIDDLKANINTAKQRGWNTLQAFGYELDTIKDRVNKFLNI